MRFLVFFIVLAISAASVALGVDWLQAPMSPMATSPYQLRSAVLRPVNPPASPAVQQAAVPPAANKPAASMPTETPAPVAAAPAAAAPAPVAAVTPAPQSSSLVTPEPQQAATPAAAPLCDVAACERAYRSFTASDCTYQPSDGPRRLCTRGNPPSANAPRQDARAQATCNVAACSNAYISFNASDCSYQPSDGPRRLCEKQ